MNLKSICVKGTYIACACALCLHVARPLLIHDAPIDLSVPAIRDLPLSHPDRVYPRASALEMLQRGIVGSTNYARGGIVKMHDEWTGSSFSAVSNHVLTPFYADISTTLSSY